MQFARDVDGDGRADLVLPGTGVHRIYTSGSDGWDGPIEVVYEPGRGDRSGLIRGLREVFPPVLMSTLAIIVSFTPMFFITGMMGPYMGPMAINVRSGGAVRFGGAVGSGGVALSTACAAMAVIDWGSSSVGERAKRGSASRPQVSASPTSAISRPKLPSRAR